MTYLMIEGDQAHTSGPNGPVTRVVIHATVSPCVPGGARGNARYFQSKNAGGLAHYVVDPGETVQCCKETIACWHAPPNRGSIGVELCDPQAGDPSRWADGNHRLMLRRAAVLVADLCKRHQLPLEYVDHRGLVAGRRGITTHHEVVLAWHQSTHTDPGPGFPMAEFIQLVRQAAGPTPVPPTSPEEDVMASLDEVRQVVKEELAAVVKQMHAEHVLLLHGDASHGNSLDAIAEKVGVPQA